MKGKRRVLDFFPVTTTSSVFYEGTNRNLKEMIDEGGGRDVQPSEIFESDDSIDVKPFILAVNEGANSGDVLDKESPYYLQNRTQNNGYPILNSLDLNNMVSGIYSVSSTCDGLPVASNGVLLVMYENVNTNYGGMIFLPHGSEFAGSIYNATIYNGTILGGWRKSLNNMTDVIKDDIISSNTTWSSKKIDDMKANRADAISYDDFILNGNNFISRKLFLEELNDAFFLANKRWEVTGKLYTKGTDVENATLNEGEISKLFTHNAETWVQIPFGQYLKLVITFPDPGYPGYDYGEIVIAFYNNSVAESVKMRSFSNWQSTSGWNDMVVRTIDDRKGTKLSRVMAGKVTQYQIKTLEITIVAPDEAIEGTNATATNLVNVMQFLSRPSATNEMPFFDKLQYNQMLYYPFQMKTPSLCANLNAEFLNGKRSTDFLTSKELETYQLKTDNSLETTDKTIVGAINEVKGLLGGKKLVYLTQAEYEQLESKEPNTIYNISDKEDIFSLESNLDNINLVLNDSYNFIEPSTNVTINMPTIPDQNKKYELHLIVKMTNTFNVTFSGVTKWQSIPTLDQGTTTEFIFTYIKGEWLGRSIVYKAQG